MRHSCRCRGKAGDLREQLIYWQTPPEATWSAREERTEWLNQAMTQVRDVTIGLQQHGIDIKDTCHMKLYMNILRVRALPITPSRE